MASGFDARVAVSTAEVTYGTRVAPTRFIPITAEDFGFVPNRYDSPALGAGPWAQPSIVTTKIGTGSLSGDVPTTGFGFLLNYLNGNTNTPVIDGAGPSHTTTFNLDTLGTKSFSVQVQNPPVTSATLVPHDMLGVMMGGITFSWSPGGVLSYNIPVLYQNLDTSQSLVSYVAPSAYDLFSFTGGSLTIGGVLEANIIGDGSLAIEYPLRTAYALGSTGLIAKPVLENKPTASGQFTADFNDNTNLTRTLNNTMADVVMKFEGATINATFKYTMQVTLKDCVFTTNRATIGGPGPLQQAVSFRSAPTLAANFPVIVYRTNSATL